jgi:DNA-binding GntR family transcriptional regulator
MLNIEMDQETDRYYLRGKVYRKLEKSILNGKYKTGDGLNESKLSHEMGVSRTPIREALRQLELDGLVKIFPHKGAVVLGVSKRDIEDIYTIRKLIEGLAVRWAIEKITDEEIKKLKELVELAEFYTNKNDMQYLERIDSNFHELIYEASKSNPLMHTLKNFHHYVQRARISSFKTPGRAQKSLKEHREILQAIIDKDADRADKLMCQHVNNAAENLLKSFNFE